MSVGLSLAFAGCGGDTTAPTPNANSRPASNPVATTAQPKTKGAGGGLAEGGDLGVAERRALKQKERAAAPAK